LYAVTGLSFTAFATFCSSIIRVSYRYVAFRSTHNKFKLQQFSSKCNSKNLIFYSHNPKIPFIPRYSGLTAWTRIIFSTVRIVLRRTTNNWHFTAHLKQILYHLKFLKYNILKKTKLGTHFHILIYGRLDYLSEWVTVDRLQTWSENWVPLRSDWRVLKIGDRLSQYNISLPNNTIDSKLWIIICGRRSFVYGLCDLL